MKMSQATARRDKAKEVWLESGQSEELVAASPGAFRFLARPMQLMSTETPHQPRKNSLEAFRYASAYMHFGSFRESHREALSERTACLCCLTALQPNGGQWSLFVQEHTGGRPHHQSRSRPESGLSHPLHPPLLGDVRRNTDEHWQHRALSGPFTRGDVVFVGSELDRQIAHIHGTTIPLQPEMYLLRPHTTFRQSIGPQIVPLLMHLVASFAHRIRFPP